MSAGGGNNAEEEGEGEDLHVEILFSSKCIQQLTDEFMLDEQRFIYQ